MTGRRVRPFYGWLMASGLGLTELVSWGVLVYAFSVLVVPMRDELVLAHRARHAETSNSVPRSSFDC